ncbi:unnamed protein product [Larinioides sclopetarius]|uniref:Uncharacterized protein n=1 Tax=Larinioides sclopetarius TaxID=280406 RepID=A0AAV1YTH8_9ARAC
MATPVKGSRVYTPFFPSLSHLASAKVCFPKFQKDAIETLNTEIQRGISTSSEKGSQENAGINLLNNYLNLIPKHLRKSVWESFLGFFFDYNEWQNDHKKLYRLRTIESLRLIHWRSDGTIDRVKTAQRLVLDESLDIGKRFEVACMYCLEKSVQTLWAEMEATGKTNDFVAVDESTARFWIGWMREESRVPWIQAILKYLRSHPRSNVRYSCFFPLLRPKYRVVLLNSLRYATNDDLRFCLNAMNRKEEKKVLRLYARRLIILHLTWPLQSSFLETVEKTWNSMDFNIFRIFIEIIWVKNKSWKDFVYSELFLQVWNRSPHHLKERAREDSETRDRIDALFAGHRKIINLIYI